MIYITGDLHGDISRFKQTDLKKLKAGDTLIVCGDFGFDVRPAGAKPTQEQKHFKWLTQRPYTILFVSGAHEDHSYLNSLPEQDWKGGRVHRLAGNIYHLCSGCLFLLDEDYYLTIGGGTGEEESLLGSIGDQANDPDLFERVKAAAASRRNVVDYIISHECPTMIRSCLTGRTELHASPTTPVLDWAINECLYKKWFSGALHIDKHIHPAYYSLYRNVLPVRSGK